MANMWGFCKMRASFKLGYSQLVRTGICCLVLLAFCAVSSSVGNAAEVAPLVRANQPADWWFVFKFNTKSFPGCVANKQTACPFGGDPSSDLGGAAVCLLKQLGSPLEKR